MFDNIYVYTKRFIYRATGRTILKITYGYDSKYLLSIYVKSAMERALYCGIVKDKDDFYVNIAEEGMKNVATAEGFFLVNLIPWLQNLPTWLPGTGFKKLSQRGREIGMEMRNKSYDMVKQSIVSILISVNS